MGGGDIGRATIAPRQGPRTICPVLVGRASEFGQLQDVLVQARAGRGAAVALAGEAGIGKTRLARELVTQARAQSIPTLLGRAVQQGSTPYRALTEALCVAARAGRLPDSPQLQPFRPALGTVVPDWRTADSGVDESPVVVAEGVLRLLRLLGSGTGMLLVVDDLQWADPDTLAVLEYLADNVAAEPLAIVLTLRSAELSPAAEVLERLEARNAVRVLKLGRLDRGHLAVMAAACVEAAGKTVSADVVDTVAHRSDGLPLLVEELLSIPVSGLAEAVPDTIAETVARRLSALPAESLLVVQCAAVLGRTFDWRLLPAVTGLPADQVRRGLTDAVAWQLLSAGAEDFHFRHALVRDAVVAGLLPPTRVALARRAARAVQERPDDDAAVLAADLWAAAGEAGTAAEHLLHAGRRAIARGALVTAERLLDRAWTLPLGDHAVRTEIAEALTEALALAAKLDRALSVGADALRRLDGAAASTDRRARLHLTVARAADAATRWTLAGEHLAVAGQLAGEVGNEGLLAQVDSLAAHVAMGTDRFDDAESLAQRAAAAADRLDLPEVTCEALEVLGRRERLRDLPRAAALFEQAYDVARKHGLVLASIRALHELGTIDMFTTSAPDRLQQASELAYRAGALSVAATVDLQLLGLHAFLFELDAAMEAGRRASEVADMLGLSEVYAATQLQLGFAHALAGRPAAMEAAVESALRVAGDKTEALALAWGHARATHSLLTEDRARAAEQLSTAMVWARQAPGVTGAFPALWVLLHVVDGAGQEALDRLESLRLPVIPPNRAILGFAQAVLAGRADDPATADQLAAEADRLLHSRNLEFLRQLARRLVAEPALADGWGDPDSWLGEAMRFFDSKGHDRVAAACRALLRRAGRRVPRDPGAGLPPRLRTAGVTSREADVLRLVGDRLPNREIAERLYLSPRTVEKHVERLLQKLGASGRTDLGRVARDVFDSSQQASTAIDT